MRSIWNELKRRKVVRVATTYTVCAWLLIQVVVSVEEPLGLPDWTDTLVLLLLGVGFFIAVVLAWAFDLTPDGIRRTARHPEGGSPSSGLTAGYALTLVGAGLFGAGAVWLAFRDTDAEWLRSTALPSVEAALSVGDWQTAFAHAVEIERRVPDAPELEELWPRMAWRTSIVTDPAGATTFRRPYAGDEDGWVSMGRTPLEDVRIPYGLSELRFELEGYRPLHRTIGGGHVNWEELGELRRSTDGLIGTGTFRLDPLDDGRERKVRVPGWDLPIGGELVTLEDFYLDRYEVTNAEYKAFIDAGGYDQRGLWDPVVTGGDTLAWEDATARFFVDATGRPGPSAWEAGDYPAGEDDHPVEGVSWYEASAYARFMGEELPTAQHWQRALAIASLAWQLPESNVDGTGTRPVSESAAISYAGAYDLAGNVREWTSTPTGEEFVILGGSWADPGYVVAVGNTSAQPLNRSRGNGFRLAITSDDPPVMARVRAEVPEGEVASSVLTREPVGDAVFQAYGRSFDYRRERLDDVVEEVAESRNWVREIISFDAGYRGERMRLYLYLPTAATPPYQTVVYWPGWDTFRLTSVDQYLAKQADFVLTTGRAVAFPVYQGTFERSDGSGRPAFNSTAYRDNALDAVKDLRRTLDYLETRTDIDARSFAFYGYSWGGVNGPAALAHEPRLRAAIIYVGHLRDDLAGSPEIDPVNALPRVRIPVLLLSGEFDFLVPIENARRYFDLLGSPIKEHVETPGSHFVPREELIRRSVDWLDRHLGRPTR